MIKRSKHLLVNKIIIEDLSLASLKDDKILAARNAKNFVNRIKQAEEVMI